MLAACQAIDLRRPRRTTAILESVHALVREHVTFMDKDRFLADDIDIVAKLIKTGMIWDVVRDHVESYTD